MTKKNFKKQISKKFFRKFWKFWNFENFEILDFRNFEFFEIFIFFSKKSENFTIFRFFNFFSKKNRFLKMDFRHEKLLFFFQIFFPRKIWSSTLWQWHGVWNWLPAERNNAFMVTFAQMVLRLALWIRITHQHHKHGITYRFSHSTTHHGASSLRLPAHHRHRLPHRYQAWRKLWPLLLATAR